MVLKAALDALKPDCVSYFHADLIESLMQGLRGKSHVQQQHYLIPPFKNTVQVKKNSTITSPKGAKKTAAAAVPAAAAAAAAPHGAYFPPPLNLSKVKSFEGGGFSRRDSVGGGNLRKRASNARRKQQTRPCDIKAEVKKVDVSPKSSGRRRSSGKSFVERREREFRFEDSLREPARSSYREPGYRKVESRKGSLKRKSWKHEPTPPVLHHVTLEMDMPEVTVTGNGFSSRRNGGDSRSCRTKRAGSPSKKAHENQVDSARRNQADSSAKRSQADSSVKLSRAALSRAIKSSLEANGEGLTTARINLSAAAEDEDKASPKKKKSSFRSPRTPNEQQCNPDNQNQRSMKLPSLVPTGFGGAPAETVQTSRPSRVVLEAPPRMALTDRGSKKDKDFSVPASCNQLQSTQWDSFLTPEVVLKQYASSLTAYEQREIFKYDEIYYIGNPQKKIHAAESPGTCNYGFDNERGDYHAVSHDHLAYRYEVLSKLGKGSFGQVLKCNDHKCEAIRAVKIIRNKKQFIQQAFVETRILQFLRDKAAEEGADYNIVTLYESFEFRGHLCLSFAVHDISLFEMLKKNSFVGFSLGLVKCFAKQLLVSLDVLYRERIIHGDLKPENILLQHGHAPRIRLIDFGSSCFEHEKIYTYLQSRFYRAPEVILGLPYDMMIDVWSLACILAELFTGFPLFPGEDEIEQLAYIMEVLGTPPRELINKAKRKKMFFDSENQPRIVPNSSGAKHFPCGKDLKSAVGCNDAKFVDFLACCLKWEKEDRLTPEELLEHEWIKQVMPLTAMDEMSCKSKRSSRKRSSLRSSKQKAKKSS